MPASNRVPAQSPFASPADLARVRRPPAPSQPSQPSRGRRLAEIEKERARSVLRSLVADPATDFTALDADEFFAALKCACQDGTVNPALIAEVGRRLADGTAASRDLHQVLFAAGDDGGWSAVQSAAMAVVARRPHLAVEVVNLEVQRLGVAPMRVVESAGEGSFTARASLDRDGVTVEGQPYADTSKKRASQRAVVSLLAVLVGVPAPAATGPEGASGQGSGSSQVSGLRFAAAASAPVGPASVPAAPAMSPADLEAWLDYVVGQPEPDPELADQLASGSLTTRALYLLLFEARAQGWARHRATAWDSLVATPSQAPGVLSMYTQSRSWPPAAFVELGERTAFGYVTTPDGPVVGVPAVAAGIRAARASAALALVRDLAPPVEGDGEPAGPEPGGNPVGLLNERAQVGAIADLTYTQDTTGPAHRPVFTCTASCMHATDRYVGTAEDTSKNAAKAAAAADLLEQVRCAERAHLALPVPAANRPEALRGSSPDCCEPAAPWTSPAGASRSAATSPSPWRDTNYPSRPPCRSWPLSTVMFTLRRGPGHPPRRRPWRRSRPGGSTPPWTPTAGTVGGSPRTSCQIMPSASSSIRSRRRRCGLRGRAW